MHPFIHGCYHIPRRVSPTLSKGELPNNAFLVFEQQGRALATTSDFILCTPSEVMNFYLPLLHCRR